MSYRVKWKVSRFRKDRRTGSVRTIKRSDYLKQLFKEAEQINKREDV